MKKSLNAKKLRLNRETLRGLETTRISEVAGGKSFPCTGASDCFNPCTSVDASLCTCD